jgi:hypothetical protein
MNDLFDGAEIISCYTWDNAVDDGIFVDVSGMAKGAGFTLPVAITRSLYSSHLEVKNDHGATLGGATDLRIQTLLMLLAIHIKELKQKGEANDSMIEYHATFEEEGITTIWASIEGRSPSNPEPVMTIMLPSDY